MEPADKFSNRLKTCLQLGDGNLDLDFGQLAVIAEYSLPATSEDWGHYIILIFENGRYIEWPTDAEFSKEAISYVEDNIGAGLTFHLGSSNELTSRILWPPRLEGGDAVFFRNQADSLWQKLLSILRQPRIALYFSDVVWFEINRRQMNRPKDDRAPNASGT